jgi:hypothetical protein
VSSPAKRKVAGSKFTDERIVAKRPQTAARFIATAGAQNPEVILYGLAVHFSLPQPHAYAHGSPAQMCQRGHFAETTELQESQAELQH